VTYFPGEPWKRILAIQLSMIFSTTFDRIDVEPCINEYVEVFGYSDMHTVDPVKLGELVAKHTSHPDG
jgi:hypothetical protein